MLIDPTRAPMADVVYFVRDMLFTSKIREVARQLGVSVEGTREPSSLAMAARNARLVLVDLRLPGALEGLEALAADPSLSAIRTVGFVDHEKTDVMVAARSRGCREVLTKGQFARDLPRLLAAD
jgi:CheY-like chemotaxis protein